MSLLFEPSFTWQVYSSGLVSATSSMYPLALHRPDPPIVAKHHVELPRLALRVGRAAKKAILTLLAETRKAIFPSADIVAKIL